MGIILGKECNGNITIIYSNKNIIIYIPLYNNNKNSNEYHKNIMRISGWSQSNKPRKASLFHHWRKNVMGNPTFNLPNNRLFKFQHMPK